MDKPLEPGVRKKGRNTYQVSTEYLNEDFEKMGPEKFKQLMKDKKPKTMKEGGLSAGQKKIAAKAPPPDKIDAKDFAVLKKEKAKGRGMGLQDESVQPGKVMKAKRGEFLRSDPTKPISSVQPSTTLPKDFLGKRKALGGVRASLGMLKGPAKAGAILGAALTVPVGKMLKKIQDKRKAKNRDEAKVKKMVGGMAKKYSVGGGADMSKVKTKKKNILDKFTDKLNKAGEAYKKLGGAGLNVLRGNTKGQPFPAKKMGGGMMNKPMGYSSGSKLMDFIKSGSYTDKYGTKTNVDKAIKKINLSPKDKDLATMKPASDKKMMGGGMMNKPMGYKSGTMVKARGCKLGRTRPTKMY
jgi:hypothetical protein